MLESDWLSPHHPIPNAKFPPITKLFSKPFPKPFPKPFLKPFPAAFPKPFPKIMEVSMLEYDWLAVHHAIPKAKFPLITALLNRSTYYRSAKGLHHLVPKSYGRPKSVNKLTLNEPAIK